MSVLLTGASGFVGKNLYPYLKTYIKAEISCLYRNSHSFPYELSSQDQLISWGEFWEGESSYRHYIHLAGKAHDTKQVSADKEYIEVNYELTKKLYERFLEDPSAELFVLMSSVKAAADSVEGRLTEEVRPQPETPYGRSKLMAEDYIMENLPEDKRVIIIRPCMIHGPGNKGNLNLLYSVVSKGIPWPLGAFDNRRSFLSIDNLNYVIGEILNGKLSSGIYNIADDEALSTNELVGLIAEVTGSRSRIWNIPEALIRLGAKAGNILPLPLDEGRLQKLTENYVVSNQKLKEAVGIDRMPVTAGEGLIKTLRSFGS
ncbi:NAD-dependent epimerase/dehydratase family protein [Balneola sp. MJW-20]|uniref:NAD-dependent epimerase/dehydratase family protein n=1 Tax=Gracilimonas aurantiaca TaxID=3234185 RepID=UPI0034661CB5